MCFRPIRLLALLGIVAAATATAHHSGAMFDRSKTITLVGTIKEYQFRNPVTEEGQTAVLGSEQ